MKSRPLSLLESADRLGRCRYVELVGFARLGEICIEAQSPVVTTLLSGASKAHGYRVLQIESRLPVSVGLPGVVECTAPPSFPVEELFAVLVALPQFELLAGLQQIYGAMISAYQEHLRACSPYADPPIARLLARLVGDLHERVSEIKELLANLGSSQVNPRSIAEMLLRDDAPFGALVSR